MADDHITFRIDSDLKREFMDVVKDDGATASRVLTDFVRNYVKAAREEKGILKRLDEMEKRLEALEQKDS